MDPFSAATGVAGLISLGIEVCRGLNAYCRDYQSRDSDILALSQHAKSLEDFLRLIEGRMKGNFQVDQSLATTFEDCHATCNMCLQDFAALNTKYARPKAVSGYRKQGKAFVRQLQFPFHKHKFDGLKSQMLEFQNALSSCLLLLNYDRTTEVLHTTVSEAAKISSAIVLQGQRTTDQISLLLPQIDKSIDDRLSRLEELVLARSNKAPQTTQFHVQGEGKTIPIDDRQDLNTSGNLFDPGRQSTESPSSSVDIAMEPYPQRYQQLEERNTPLLSNFVCTCKHAPKCQPGYRSPEILEHKEVCPAAFLNKRRRTISGEIRIFSTLLRWKVSVRYSRFFLEDLQVQSNLTVTAIHDNSPAFKLINSLDEFNRQMTEDELEAKLSIITRGLRQLFMDHKAWPTDITRTDENITHRACAVFSSKKWPDNTHHLFVQLLAALVSMGVPINGDGRYGTPLRWFLYYHELNGSDLSIPKRTDGYLDHIQPYSFIARELILQGAIYSEKLEIYPLPWASWALSALLPHLGDALHGFDYGPLSSALIRRSEVDVRRLLCQSVDHVSEKGHHEQTPVHVSVYWPKGLKILFELANDACASIIDATDSTGYTPLQCAIYWPQAESVAMLLEKNATADLEDMSTYTTYDEASYGHYKLHDKEVCKVLVAALVDRRTKMLQYALEHLPESEVARFDLRNMSFLKETAFEVGESLKSCTAWVPADFVKVRPGSVYHSPFMTYISAEAMFQAGFHNTDSSWNGCTPLMMQNYNDLADFLRIFSWFRQKQANFLAIIPAGLLSRSGSPLPGPLQFRAIHRVASMLGYGTACMSKSDDNQYSQIRRQYLCLLRKIFLESCRDPCQCYCAPEGSDSISLLAKAWSRLLRDRLRMFSDGRYQPQVSNQSEDLGMMLGIISEEQDDVRAGFVRVCTFDRLEMRHTCCTHDLDCHDIDTLEPRIKLMDYTEAEEIRDEDRYLAETLEDLMVEFKPRLSDRTQSFRVFGDYWNKRMDEVNKGKDSISLEEAEECADIGVYLKAQ